MILKAWRVLLAPARTRVLPGSSRSGSRAGVGGVAGLPVDVEGDVGLPGDRDRLAEGQAHGDGVAGRVGVVRAGVWR